LLTPEKCYKQQPNPNDYRKSFVIYLTPHKL
jgi:hypothetical protein